MSSRLHSRKHIKSPIIKKSFGIICAKYNLKTKQVEFLLIQKRNTFCYIEFLLKSIIKNDDIKLIYLLDHMTKEEKIDILSLDFGRMWYRIWMVNPDSPYTPDHLKLSSDKYEKYLICKNNFENNFLKDKGKKLKDLICRSKHSECLWEIPKGRKYLPQERDLNCAIREFEEETGISSADYKIVEDNPIITSNIALNIKYINYFYLAILTREDIRIRNPRVNFANVQQLTEVSDICWADVNKINILDHSKKIWHITKDANHILRKKYKIQKLYELNLLNETINPTSVN